jgi:hypothetical protein
MEEMTYPWPLPWHDVALHGTIRGAGYTLCITSGYDSDVMRHLYQPRHQANEQIMFLTYFIVPTL